MACAHCGKGGQRQSHLTGGKKPIMKNASIPPYHAFIYKNLPFVFDIQNGVFFRITRSAYRLLQTAEAGDRAGARKGMDEAARELRLLREKGFFPLVAKTFTQSEDDRFIDRLVKMPTNKIDLSLAESCNLACKYCYCRTNQALRKGLMPEDVALRAIDFLMERGGGGKFPSYEVTFFGGEPLLNKPVMKKVIAYLETLVGHSAELHFSLTTNGTLLDDEVIHYIKKYNFGLMISIDGPPHVHDAMRPFRNGRGSFERVARNVKRLMRIRKRVTARVTLTKNCLDMVGIVRFLEDFGFARIGLSSASGTSFGKGRYDLDGDDEKVLEAQSEILRRRFFRRLRSNELPQHDPAAGAIEHLLYRRLVRMRCGVGRGTSAVGIEGKLYPCHRYVGMENYVLGNIWDGIDKEKYRTYLKGYFSTKEKCQECWAVHFCGGTCPWYLSHPDGYFVPPSDEHCDRIRRGLEGAAWVVDKVSSEFPEYYARMAGLTKETESEFLSMFEDGTTVKAPTRSDEAKVCI